MAVFANFMFFPFTQDPRLLGEIHVALLRTVIKDIEDVARTPSIGLGVNLNSVANPVGGHPQIVEGVCSLYLLLMHYEKYEENIGGSKAYIFVLSGVCMGF